MTGETSSEQRPRLVVALTFPVFPARGGGQVRVLHLYRELARWFEIDLVCLAAADAEATTRTLAPGLREHTVPKTARHAAAELELEREAGTVVTDVAMVRLHGLTPSYGETIGRLAAGARAAVACHPYPYEAIRAATDVPLWYEAQDIEASLKAAILEPDGVGGSLLEDVARVEGACSVEAESIWTCSAEDRDALVARYGAAAERVRIVPNGVSVSEIDFADWPRRAGLRADLRLPPFGQMLFTGSWHEPNIVAARILLETARELPGTEFLILGSVGLALDRRWVPPNVRLLGTVEERFKQAVLSSASAAVNPMTTGSGTNLKMLEYFAAGTPVISTAFGARGLGVSAGEHYIEAEPWSFAAGIRELAAMAPEQIAQMTEAARRHVERHLSWPVIARALAAELPERAVGAISGGR
jgi:glycosyltransferase involved in cell wall biosynthesis